MTLFQEDVRQSKIAYPGIAVLIYQNIPLCRIFSIEQIVQGGYSYWFDVAMYYYRDVVMQVTNTIDYSAPL